jgi:hypothetical protein
MKPAQELIEKGIADLENGLETVPSLLVSIGAPRLRNAGLLIPHPTFPNPEHRLYALLRELHGDNAHSQFNAYIRRLVSFERATECVN